ncbi:RNA polymerase ECF family sigma subunit [Prosthecobacter fusiformis]|uniref:RNA polymerase ECF family sigma subunit n=1 Tax=Prosthecobacter fusiformis TaxID=48464 RepID=A0A4R7RWL7_9BACT|nr:sigma-70 family RNA polymerase sigma factor [Prosthecobacter fusiformis]TDU69255.1 RNA polymerase ECF family sigma subunit [Prosthecobacter fusiformis]
MFADSNNAISAWLVHRDQSAARWLVHTHSPQVLSLARRWGAPAEMEQDVLQEVFMRVFKALPRLDLTQPFAPWLTVLARNTCSKLRRRWCHRHRLSACFENAALDVDTCELADERDAHQIIASQERQDLLDEAMRQLPERDRSLLNLQYGEGRSGSEIATAMGVSAGTVRVSIHRIRHRLTQEISRLSNL